MHFFLIAFVLTSTSALAQSLPGQQASKLVLLAGETKSLPPPPPATVVEPYEDPFALLNRRMVSMQLQLLEIQRVPLAGPLTTTLFGGTGTLVGVAMLLIGVASYGFFIVGLIVLGVSSLPLLIGIPWLVGTRNTNARIDLAIEKVKKEQRQLSTSGSRPIEPLGGAGLAF